MQYKHNVYAQQMLSKFILISQAYVNFTYTVCKRADNP